ncbi:MAG: hypothetical protein IKY83_03680 [Proteobacteria bacterium]|nr:hypothetical protein [Pseudomonadota bacterium]
MAKLDAKKLKSAASKGGVKVPAAPKAPKVPAVKPDQLKKQAQAKAKARMKMLIRVLVVAAVVAVIGVIVYFVKFHGRQPKDAFNNTVEYAYGDKIEKFRNTFTQDSIELVESGQDNPDAAWEHLIDGITPAEHPTVIRQTIEDEKGIRTAVLTVKVDGEQRTVNMREEDGRWKVNLNVALNPKQIVLPDDIPPDYIENFAVADEHEPWWENSEEGGDESGKKGESKGLLGRLKIGKLFKK